MIEALKRLLREWWAAFERSARAENSFLSDKLLQGSIASSLIFIAALVGSFYAPPVAALAALAALVAISLFSLHRSAKAMSSPGSVVVGSSLSIGQRAAVGSAMQKHPILTHYGTAQLSGTVSATQRASLLH